jgi:hypothetical protein
MDLVVEVLLATGWDVWEVNSVGLPAVETMSEAGCSGTGLAQVSKSPIPPTLRGLNVDMLEDIAGL